MVKMIHLNFNPNIFLETLQELNSSHFKSLYFMEEPISTKDIQKIFTVLKDTNLKLHEFKGTHEPIPDVVFLTKLNLGYFRMLSLGQDFLGTITDENKVNSFLDEFKIEYTRLK
jgi:hypothetical protein